MSGLNCMTFSSTLNNNCNATQLDKATKCHHAFKNFWGDPYSRLTVVGIYSLHATF